MDARDWIVRLTSGDVSEADLKRFRVWRDASILNRQAFEKERSFWQGLQAIEAEAGISLPPQRQQHMQRLKMGRRAFLAGGGMAAAASIAAVSLPALRIWWQADFATAVGQQAEIALPDGSLAFLNTDSAISVEFRPDLRLVNLLKGEADFRVKQQSGSVFRVASFDGTSDALATTFTVRKLWDETTITVSDGQVRVTAAPDGGDKNSVLLSAGEQTRYFINGAVEPVQHVDLEAELAWKTGRLIFEGRSFGTVVADIGRYLPERIVMGPGVNAETPVSGIFATSELLPAIRALSETQGLSVHRVPGVVIVIT